MAPRGVALSPMRSGRGPGLSAAAPLVTSRPLGADGEAAFPYRRASFVSCKVVHEMGTRRQLKSPWRRWSLSITLPLLLVRSADNIAMHCVMFTSPGSTGKASPKPSIQPGSPTARLRVCPCAVEARRYEVFVEASGSSPHRMRMNPRLARWRAPQNHMRLHRRC